MVIMMKNYFCGMVDRRKTFILILAGIIVRDPHHRESSRISDTSRVCTCAKPELGLVELSCAVVITTTQRRHTKVLHRVL